jgi:hypothetical protein
VGGDDDANGSERDGHGSGSDRRLVTIGGRKVGDCIRNLEKAPRDQSPREALGGSWEHSAVHWGEVRISISRGLVGEQDQSPGYAVQHRARSTLFKLLHSCGFMQSDPTLANVVQHGQTHGLPNS